MRGAPSWLGGGKKKPKKDAVMRSPLLDDGAERSDTAAVALDDGAPGSSLSLGPSAATATASDLPPTAEDDEAEDICTVRVHWGVLQNCPLLLP